MSEADTSTEANEGPSPIELDEAMIAYIEKIVYKIADKLFDKRVDREELIQKIFLRYLEKPPIWNPAKGASKETFVYRCVYCDLVNEIDPMQREAEDFQQAPSTIVEKDDNGNGHSEDAMECGSAPRSMVAERSIMDRLLEHVPCEESRRLCLAYIKHNGVATATAKELGISDKTVVKQLERLVPKLLAAGYLPPPKLKEVHGLHKPLRGDERASDR